jgi:hypothetical protein
MLRGSVVIFTSIFSVVFLKRKLHLHHWVGILLVIGGTAIVGAQSKVCGAEDSDSCPDVDGVAPTNNNAMIGNILIIAAQIIVAVQMVVEEKFISGYNVPALQVVGFEGFFGMTTLSVVLLILYNIPSVKQPYNLCAGCCPAVQDPSSSIAADWNCTMIETCSHFEDPIDAFAQFSNSGKLVAAVLGNVFSIAFFNYFGVSVTKHINASTRMVLDSLRTMVIWAFSLAVQWETFCWVEIIGFIVLLTGTVIYNAIIKLPWSVYEDAPSMAKVEQSSTPLLADQDGMTVDGGHSLNAAHDSNTISVSYEQLTSTPTLSHSRMMKQK